MFERIIVNQIEILPDNQVQDDFEKDLTARQRFIPSESARVSSSREKPVSALTRTYAHLWKKRVSALTMLLNGFGAIGVPAKDKSPLRAWLARITR